MARDEPHNKRLLFTMMPLLEHECLAPGWHRQSHGGGDTLIRLTSNSQPRAAILAPPGNLDCTVRSRLYLSHTNTRSNSRGEKQPADLSNTVVASTRRWLQRHRVPCEPYASIPRHTCKQFKVMHRTQASKSQMPWTLGVWQHPLDP